jgi:hypothetical protein
MSVKGTVVGLPEIDVAVPRATEEPQEIAVPLVMRDFPALPVCDGN